MSLNKEEAHDIYYMIFEEVKHLRRNSYTLENFAECIIKDIFLNEMGYKHKQQLVKSSDIYYDFIIDNKILIRGTIYNEIEKEINNITNEINEKYEWGILFTPTGIYVVNRDIEVRTDDAFRSKKIVFEFVFGRKSDTNYFKYLAFSELIGECRNACYFRDIIVYKNTLYKGSSKSWIQYHTTLKRFLDYYAEKKANYSRNSNPYIYIHLSHLEEYLRDTEDITTERTIKNTFFYTKQFMCCKNENSEFNISSKDVLKKFKGELIENTTELVYMDEIKLGRAYAALHKGNNHLKKEIVFLFLLSFGIKRGCLCQLEWNRDIVVREHHLLKFRTREYEGVKEKEYPMPRMLAEKLIMLRNQERSTKFVFEQKGKPLREDIINTFLADIPNVDISDMFYKQLTPNNIRKWLVQYLLDEGYPLQSIMGLMEIPSSNLPNCTSNAKIRNSEPSRFLDSNVHPMECFLERSLRIY